MFASCSWLLQHIIKIAFKWLKGFVRQNTSAVTLLNTQSILFLQFLYICVGYIFYRLHVEDFMLHTLKVHKSMLDNQFKTESKSSVCLSTM